MKLQAQLAEYTVRVCRRKTTVRKQGCQITFDPKQLQGLCDYNTKTIFVAANLKQDGRLTTLYHEYLHALFFELDRDEISYNEGLIETLSQNIARVARTLDHCKET